MANKLMLYARNIEVNDKRIDLSSGKVIAEKYNSLAELKKLGIKYVEMPENYELYEKKTNCLRLRNVRTVKKDIH